MTTATPCYHPTDPTLALLPVIGSDRPAVIDAYALPATSGHTWRLVGRGYVATSIQRHVSYLHHWIAGVVPGCEIHHEDDDKLNNRADNLGHLTSAEHHREHQLRRGPAPGKTYKGVSRDPDGWFPQIRINGKMHRSGRYHSEEAAARAYDLLADKMLGTGRGYRNFPAANPQNPQG